MSAAIEIIELEPLALSPAVAARYLSISKRSISRLIAKRRIEAHKAGPRRLVDVVSLKANCGSLAEKHRASADCVRPPRACGTAAAQPDPSLMI
jgi:excisionase family DNA binding protein